MHMCKFAAIVLSAGVGRRMNSDVPKQYLPLCGKPVIYYSLKAFEESGISDIILVTGAEDVDYCREQIVEKYHLNKVKAIVPGGRERYDSVFEGLRAAEGADYVLIHDGARPMLSLNIIQRSMEAVQAEEACAVGMPVKDTIKIVDTANYAIQTPDRSTLWMVQTPQSFSYSIIMDAFAELSRRRAAGESVPAITDDAMMVEQLLHHRVKLIEGSYENLKITTPEDLIAAEVFLRSDK